MKCEICHKADAATVLHRKKKDGSDEELYVCKACAAQSGDAAKRHRPDAKNDGPTKVTFAEGEPPPFVENFVKAALGLVEGITEQEKDKKACPGCGHTWEQIKDEKRVGCPRCYRTFAELIRTEFLTGKDSRAYLERELKAAVRHQQFEKAAQIRRRLDALGDTNRAGGHPDKPKPK